MKGFLEEYGLVMLETIVGLAGLVALVSLILSFSQLADFVATKLIG